ncbi:MAG: type II secretion system F family protein [Planctomycetota bacterium]|jgi:tight adherence protein C
MNFAEYTFLIPILAFVSVMAFGVLIIIARENKKKVLKTRLLEEHVIEEVTETEDKPKTTFLNFVEKIGNYVSHGNPTTTLAEQLIRAGYLKKSASAIYTGVKMLLFITGLITTALIVMPIDLYITTKIISVFLGGIILFFIPNIIIQMQLKKRCAEIGLYLPEAIDLLEICVSSGIGMDMAWNIVADEIKSVSSVLADSMALSDFEIHLGADRVEAMRHMAARTGVQELSSLAAILVQTERFGTSIGTTLQIFATSIREERNFNAHENAEKMAVKLLIPMVLFIFPAVLITVVGPAVITIAQVVMSGN